MVFNVFLHAFFAIVFGSFTVEADDVIVDDLGFIYAVQGQDLIKWNEKGEQLFVFSRLDLGMPEQIDVSDPLRPLLLYPETGTLVVLDNTLSEQRTVRLWDSDLGLPQWVASGVNEEIWVYDALNKEIFRTDERLDRQVSTGYLPNITGRDVEFIGMVERHERLLIGDAGYGFWVFDRFGTLVRRIPIQGLVDFRAHAEGVFIRTEEQIMWLRYNGVEPKVYEGLNPASTIDVTGSRVYNLENGVLEISSF
ncbi:hypothetical protein [Sanyastnella coralliicola]|uniref:hypothetical protein n=1 Tax=Sanyastnella coralliicola TaxID=3069118 RepID=UPI0027B8AE27|nr:hypothetical protein [Longitalea sp. SCSIO 12813]